MKKGNDMERATGRKSKLQVLVAVALLMQLFSLSTASAANDQGTVVENSDYLIGAGDVLEVMIWKNDELSKILPVRPDGKISLPLVGEVVVEGKTVKNLSDELLSRFSNYVTSPVVYISVKQVNSMNVYIIGRVNSSGVRPIYSKTTVLQGLAMASGLTPFAEGDKIKVFRKEADGTTSIFKFNFDDVSRGRNLNQNIYLKRGDVIVIP